MNTQIGQNYNAQIVITENAQSDSRRTIIVPLGGEQLLGRPTKSVCPDIPVRSAVVSRSHGRLITGEAGSFYIDLGSMNGTLYNGVPLAPHVMQKLEHGDVLTIHGSDDPNGIYDVSIAYKVVRPDHVQAAPAPYPAPVPERQAVPNPAPAPYPAPAPERQAAPNPAPPEAAQGRPAPIESLSRPNSRQAHDGPSLSIDIHDRSVGSAKSPKVLLRDIRMDIESGSMVLILGGSGAGKTTFINAVMGYEPANGKIIYNNVDLYENYDKMKYEVGYVPQQDLLRMNDTVNDTLLNAAQMKLPAGTKSSEINARLDETMEILGLAPQRDSLVGKLSGGQRKRLSIAVEYIGNPALFFLDEPDSGLDGTMAEQLMQNLRQIADFGKIVIVISHSPDRAFDLFDKVIVLTKDSVEGSGHLAFYGSPSEALRFFEVDSLEHVVKRINRTDEGGDGLADFYIEKYNRMRGGF